MPESPQSPPIKYEQSWIQSVAVWLCLFVAAALYAAAYLSPKLLSYAQLRSTHHDNRAELITLQQHCEHLKLVETALDGDPTIKAELARIEFDKVDPGEQRIRVGNGLTLNAIAAPPLKPPAGSALPWYTPALEFLNGNRSYTSGLLLAAAILVAVGFLGVRPRNLRAA